MVHCAAHAVPGQCAALALNLELSLNPLCLGERERGVKALRLGRHGTQVLSKPTKLVTARWLLLPATVRHPQQLPFWLRPGRQKAAAALTCPAEHCRFGKSTGAKIQAQAAAEQAPQQLEHQLDAAGGHPRELQDALAKAGALRQELQDAQHRCNMAKQPSRLRSARCRRCALAAWPRAGCGI